MTMMLLSYCHKKVYNQIARWSCDMVCGIIIVDIVHTEETGLRTSRFCILLQNRMLHIEIIWLATEHCGIDSIPCGCRVCYLGYGSMSNIYVE